MPYTSYEPPPKSTTYVKMLTEYAEAAECALERRRVLLTYIAEMQKQKQDIPAETVVLRRRADLLLTEVYEIRATMRAIRKHTT